MSWNWDHLRFFLALAEQGTLSDAARQLGVSHSTVQRRIQAFESDLGTPLFEHRLDGYVMTAAGNTLHSEAATIRDSLDRISTAIIDSSHRVEGEVVITTTDTLAYAILPPMLSALADEYDGLRFTLSMLNRFSDIQHHEADIGIRTGLVPPEELIGRQVGTVGFRVCASSRYLKAHPSHLFPDVLEGHRYIVLDDSYADTPMSRWLNDRLPADSPCTVANNFLSAAALCRAGLGITVLPEYLFRDDPDLVQLDAEPPIPRNALWIVSHSANRDTERVRVVRRYLYEELSHLFGPVTNGDAP